MIEYVYFFFEYTMFYVCQMYLTLIILFNGWLNFDGLYIFYVEILVVK